MLGAVAGDIIGSPYEWSNTGDRYFELRTKEKKCIRKYLFAWEKYNREK